MKYKEDQNESAIYQEADIVKKVRLRDQNSA